MKILAIIPARSGSKSLKNKNIRLIKGKPLIVYSVEHALESEKINRVIFSSDSVKYINIAKKYGAEAPFIRPKEIALDNSTDLEVFTHALNWLRIHEQYIPDICVHLRPTYPIRNYQDIDKMIEILINDLSIDSVRSISISPDTPYKMWSRNKKGIIKPIINSSISEAYNKPRQILPIVYLQNASIDVIRTSVILEKKSMSGEKIFGYIMEENWDIDNITQLNIVKKNLK